MGPMFKHCVAGKPEGYTMACALVIHAVFLLASLPALAQI